LFGFSGVGGTPLGGTTVIPIGLPSLILIGAGLGVAALLQARKRLISHG
jgi:hypothetical protein